MRTLLARLAADVIVLRRTQEKPWLEQSRAPQGLIASSQELSRRDTVRDRAPS